MGKVSRDIVKIYKQPQLYYNNAVHFYNTCKKVLGYESDDDILIKICETLYREDIINYKEGTLVKGNGICSFFYFQLKENIEKFVNGEVNIEEILKLSYDKFYSDRNVIMSREKDKRECKTPLEEESWAVIESLSKKSGIYFLYSDEGNLGYIGKSYNLSNRILSSIRERGLKYFKFAITKTKADANIYEMYYITKLNPFFNGDSITDDYPTIELPELDICNKLYFLDIGK